MDHQVFMYGLYNKFKDLGFKVTQIALKSAIIVGHPLNDHKLKIYAVFNPQGRPTPLPKFAVLHVINGRWEPMHDESHYTLESLAFCIKLWVGL